MITATIEGNLYEIEFQHTGKDAPRHVRHTLCTVRRLAPNKTCLKHGKYADGAYRAFSGVALESGCPCLLLTTATGHARCNPIDGFNKETGRKLALGRALLEAEPNKHFRQLCWGAYFTRSRVGGKEIDTEIGLVED